MRTITILNRRLTRRRFLELAGATLAWQLPFIRGLAQGTIEEPIRIGAVLPLRNSLMRMIITDPVGDAARMGAIMGGDDIEVIAQELGVHLEVLLANAPNEDTALRAAQRLIATEDICALIGGLGPGQAEVLNRVANERNVLFFNIGSPSDALRGEACGRYTFHVEASTAMYLDAIAGYFTHSGHHRWFFVYPGSDEGRALYRRAVKAVTDQQEGTSEVGQVEVELGQLVFNRELSAISSANPDIVLVLLDAVDQEIFLLQYELFGLDFPVAAFPDPISQTRHFFATLRDGTPRASTNPRIALWETTLDTHGAGTLNDRFMSRWGEPMDPPAWAAYQSVKMLFEAVISTGTLESSALVEYLESPEAVFDLYKGPGTSFRPWDHQLRQPLYAVRIDSEAQWGISLSRRVDFAELVGELPALYLPTAHPIERLDQLGDGPEESRCHF